MLEIAKKLRQRRNEKGASAVEYGLLVALIAAIIVGIVFALGQVVRGAFSKTCDGIVKGTSGSCATS